MAYLTPLHQERPTVIRDPLSGQFLVSGPRKTADVLEGFGVSKRDMSESELAHRKRAQGYISRTTSTLGLAALGLKGGSMYAARVGRAAQGTRRGIRMAARAEKLNNAALNTGIVGSGIGGVGGYNFASYTAAEAKRRNVKKNWESGMDFGLGTVHQGEHEEISKLQMPKMPKMPSFGMGRFSTGSAANATVKGSVVPPSIKQIGNKPHKQGKFTPMQRNLAIGAGGGLAVGGGVGYGVHRHNKNNQIGKAFSFRPLRAPKVKAAAAGQAAGVARGLAMVNNPKVGNVSRVASQKFAAPTPRLGVQKAYDPERNRQRRLRAYGDTGLLAAGGLGAGAAVYGHRSANAAKEYRARKGSFSAKGASLPKMGEHEAGPKSTRAALHHALEGTRNDLGSAKSAFNATSHQLKDTQMAHAAGVKAIKHGGKAAGLAAGAAGLAYGSHRLRQYSKGRGRTYKPMRSIEY